MRKRMRLWEKPEPLDTTFEHTCKCGEKHVGDWGLGIDNYWRCKCGEMYYVDPAGRTFGTKAIEYAHKTWGHFGPLFEGQEDETGADGAG